MPAYTNMAWPGDPYGTGQLWRKEPRLLVGLAIHGVNDEDPGGLGFAITYLRLSRTPPTDLTTGLSFGFRAAAAVTPDERDQLVRLFDLEVLRARRLAKIIAGYHLAEELAAMCAISQRHGRGMRGLSDWWEGHDDGSAGLARTFDLGREGPPVPVDLATVAQASSIALPAEHPAEQPAAMWLAAAVTERALLYALVAGRSLGQAFWEGCLDCGAVMAENAWDCFDNPESLARQH